MEFTCSQLMKNFKDKNNKSSVDKFYFVINLSLRLKGADTLLDLWITFWGRFSELPKIETDR